MSVYLDYCSTHPCGALALWFVLVGIHFSAEKGGLKHTREEDMFDHGTRSIWKAI